MEDNEKTEKLKLMLETAQSLEESQDPLLNGDIQTIIAILFAKLNLLDPDNYYRHSDESRNI